ncbi:MAG: hypothetical protein LR120_10635, partial [Dehalococcoidia bacterium]|nr:hypothetical protein [Dehalococcoidia bacterium]
AKFAWWPSPMTRSAGVTMRLPSTGIAPTSTSWAFLKFARWATALSKVGFHIDGRLELPANEIYAPTTS